MQFWSWYVRRGRIDRRTFWLHYFLPLWVLSVAVEVIDRISRSRAQTPGIATHPPAVLIWLPLLLTLLTACPAFSSQATRLHDRDRSAWWLLFNLLPLAGQIVLLVQMCLPGDPGPNRYGPPPGSSAPLPDGPSAAAQYQR